MATKAENRKLAALRWINEVRTNQGLETIGDILPGIAKSAFSCAITHSLSYGREDNIRVCSSPSNVLLVSPEGMIVDDIKVPTDVSKFIRDFDKGKYPEYLKESYGLNKLY